MSDVIQTLPAFLAEPIDAISTQIVVKNLKDSRGRPITTMIGNILYATIEPTSQNNQEIISFTGLTDLGNNLVRLTGVTRNLNPIPPHTALTADVPHGTGATIIVTDTPQFWNERAAKDKNESITGLWNYSVANRPLLASDVDASDNREFVTKGELLRAAFGAPTVLGVIVGGTAGQNITARQVVWLDETLGTWKLADGATLSEVNGTKKLGIALSTTTSGNSITSGVQLNGSISGFTGLSVGLVYVNDAGNVSNTPGTNVRPIGVAISSSGIIFDQAQATILSKTEKDALQGTSGTPSNTNRYVTNDDTSATPTANKVVRYDAAGIVPQQFNPFGDGSDGDVTITSGTTTLTRNMYYNNLTINVGATLNPNGWAVYVKNTFTNNGTVSSNGGAGGAGGAGADNNAGGVGAGGSGGTAGAIAHPQNFVKTLSGVAGGQGDGFSSESNPNKSRTGDSAYGVSTGSPVSGGVGGIGGVFGGGAGGTSTPGTKNTPQKRLRSFAEATSPFGFTVSGIYWIESNASNPGGGGGGAGALPGGTFGSGGGGGGSGANGGTIFIACFTFAGNGSISAVGGAGGNGGRGGDASGAGGAGGGGGGGAGGNGGLILLCYKSKTYTGTTAVTGGAFGTGGAAGTGGGGGQTAGANGTSGVAGLVIENVL